jgi:hypothetical protein
VKVQRLGPLCRDSNPISALKSNMRQRTSSAVSLCRTKSWIESACLHESSAESDNGPEFWRHTGDTSDLKIGALARHSVQAVSSISIWNSTSAPTPWMAFSTAGGGDVALEIEESIRQTTEAPQSAIRRP